MSSLFDTDDFNRRLFFLRDDDSAPPPGARDAFVDVDASPHAASVPVRVHVRIHTASVEHALVLLFHGNGEVAGDYDDIAPFFASLQASLAVVDYRGYGKSSGVPTLRAVVSDAAAVLAFVAADADARGMRGLPIVVLGRSLGSLCAQDLYARDARHRGVPYDSTQARRGHDDSTGAHDIAGVILESGIAELAGLVERRGLRAQLTDDDAAAFDPRVKLALGTAPLLVIHGADDDVIEPGEARVALAAASHARDKALVIIEGRGHNDIVGCPEWCSAIARFVSQSTTSKR